MYYRSVEELPLKTLFKIFETDDLYLLVKKYEDRKKIPKEDLEIAWEEINGDYRKLDGKNIVSRVVRVSVKIDYLKAKHQMVSLCVYLLRFGRDKELEDRLSRAGYKVSEKDYEKGLDDIEYNAKALESKVGIKEAELAKLTEDDSVVKSDINKMLASMSSSLGIAFKFNEITVVEFFGYKDALGAKAKQQSKSVENVRR